MIVRHLAVRQSRQFLALSSRRAPAYARFLSTETPVDTPAPVAQEPAAPSIVSSLESQPSQPKTNLTESEERWQNWETSKTAFHKLGSSTSASYEPVSISPSEITLEHLLAAGTHMGHSTSRWNPQNSRYIFGIREGVHIISLDVTAAYLRRAAKVVEEVAARGGIILFAGTRKGQKRSIVNAAHMAKAYHIYERWIPGSLTNGEQILGHCETKVVNAYDQELTNFKNDLQDRPVVKPDLVVVLNPLENVVLLHECGLNNVPTVGIIDTDADPTRVTYPIPANDDSLRSTDLIAGVLGRAGQAGQKRRMQAAHEGKFSYAPISPEWLRLDPFTGSAVGGQQTQK